MDQLNSGIAVHSTDKHQQCGLRNRRVGGWGNKQWGKHSIRPAIVVFLQRGKKNFAIFFCGTHFCEGHKAKN